MGFVDPVQGQNPELRGAVFGEIPVSPATLSPGGAV
jgi:hypothetical protein